MTRSAKKFIKSVMALGYQRNEAVKLYKYVLSESIFSFEFAYSAARSCRYANIGHKAVFGEKGPFAPQEVLADVYQILKTYSAVDSETGRVKSDLENAVKPQYNAVKSHIIIADEL